MDKATFVETLVEKRRVWEELLARFDVEEMLLAGRPGRGRRRTWWRMWRGASMRWCRFCNRT
ncbi:hypothetical protein [Dictyobacter kobayashii]|nr:hypothetical protein [Dictyobacter kobayashii]